MELKEIIAELREVDPGEGIPFAVYERRQKVLAAAAEALALVAWAEERKLMLRFEAEEWHCGAIKRNGMWDESISGAAATLLGAIRAAKEAYEQQG